MVVGAAPRLQAAADGAAGVVVVERRATTLHVVHQALLLGPQLLKTLLLPPLLLRQALLVLHLLRIGLAQEQLYHVRDEEPNPVRTGISKRMNERKTGAGGGQKEVQDEQEANHPALAQSPSRATR